MTSRKFVTDLFTSATEHLSYPTLQEAAQSLMSNRILPDSLTECEEPCICFDVTGDLAKLMADMRDPNDRDSEWARELHNWLQTHGAVSVREAA